jgi:amino acid transporter
LSISALLYVLVSLVAVVSMPADQLAGSDAPLALIYQHNTGRDPVMISLIGLFAVINGALIQIIMASRILYGLSRKGWLPSWLGRVSVRTQTPVLATALIAFAVLALSLGFGMAALAENTSFVILLVFVLINLSLIRIKRRDPKPYRIRVYPMWLPVVGLVTSCGFVLFKLARMLF